MKNYNKKLFWKGFALNVVNKFPLLLIASGLGIAGIWKRPCLYFSFGVLLLVLIWSFVQQLRIKYSVENSDNPNFAPFADTMASDNWQQELKKFFDDKTGKKD